MRAHTRGSKALEMSAWEPSSYSLPNDRFPFQPGSSYFRSNSSGNDKKSVLKSTHTSCIACQYKLKHDSKDFIALKRKISDNFGRQRWFIPPQGRLVSEQERKSSVRFNIPPQTPTKSDTPRSTTEVPDESESGVSASKKKTPTNFRSKSVMNTRSASYSPIGMSRPRSVSSALGAHASLGLLKDIQVRKHTIHCLVFHGINHWFEWTGLDPIPIFAFA